ncbi:MAG: AraC family transcriptional regulator, partial [Pseudomonadota bacterium]
MSEAPQHFVFLLLERFTLLAFSSAVEPLRLANQNLDKTVYTWTIASESGGPVASSAGISIAADHGLTEVPRDSTIIVCGGLNIKAAITKPVLTWLRREERRGVAMGAICTASQVLAQAGLLDGKRATIHWYNRDAFAEEFPEIELTQNIYVIDGTRYTA